MEKFYHVMVASRDDVVRVSIESLRTWPRVEKLASLLADNYKLLSVSCEGCKMFRLVGQRYHCPTCVNYDLFSTCKKKGHEHALLFQPQPNDNNEE
ncbi:unnamed protein product [Rotaria magnacalcarata]|uniref:ZZ-type domain-containing protein n=1 Tax=Rotaria magnacalcarata TaxID=392030 RepID=A0A816ZWY1_9BILA|nr:unnamed protein product [Rotaria magnacalcarata]